ncbi:patatin-like phospholipase family protein [Anaerobacillus sp. CMMVII]|uniref:patatin-like phospholipase family protein n=1 Tax=Anaerobacillus sp. CMMVII TaxID=2755588 RepID=UPI0021B7B93B|nr:patatin-like phospholipase family protein [Anaerobacillus sp. CMMVII]MCT8139042.1 patatin-like phospholipase family protein [Anaerobacillus sp. CMMVII]
MDGPKIGLALGSGGARGFAHIGVIKVLEEANIPIHYIAGSSMGALVGAFYGVGYTPEQMIKMAIHFQRKYYLDFTVPKMGFILGEKVKQLIRILTKNKKIEDLTPVLTIVATDLLKGEKVVFKEGDISTAVRASISIPGIFVPEKVGDTLLVDGAVIDRVPVSEVKKMDADIVIAVDVSYFEVEPQINSIFDVIMQSMDIMEREMIRHREIESDIMIKPIINHHSSTAFKSIEKIIQQGEDAAQEKLPEIQLLLKNWKEK